MILEKKTAQFELARIKDPRPQLALESTREAVDRARRRIAPLWPLHSYVAVNPFLGISDHDFAAAARLMARRAGARLTAPRDFYAAALDRGRITTADLEAALEAAAPVEGAPQDAAALAALARRQEPDPALALLPTVADVAYAVTGRAWNRFVTEAVSRWAAAYFDQGQAYWKSPWRELPPFAAWRAEAAIDRTPELSGVAGFRKLVAALPESAEATISFVLRRLRVSAAGIDAYLHRLLLTIGGWAGYARFQLWEAELRGGDDRTLDDLLAIRLVWELALLEGLNDDRLTVAWATRRAELADPGVGAAAEVLLAGDLLLQQALEHAYQRTLIETVNAGAGISPPATTPHIQAAFCIDVRSEIIRRALETVDGGIETIGFAGFFGFPIEYVPLGDKAGGAQCPALLAPQFVIREGLTGADEEEEAVVVQRRSVRRRAAKAWRSFKFGAVACFGFVGPVGLAYLKNLVGDALGRTRPVPHPATYGLDGADAARLGPDIGARADGETGRLLGLTPAQRIETAAGVLRAMSLTDNFAPLVLLVGHGSTTVNNPYATGLDCGACGGHTGEANARVAAAVLNDPAVRDGLRAQGIDVPAGTRFVAALHDTTTDEIRLLDREQVPDTHTVDLLRFAEAATTAGHLARAERAPRLKLDAGADVDAAVLARSRDWSQVRPEWGLAGCAAFVVAPRRRTRHLDLGGRVFLHSYDWTRDQEFGVLELIMTAPMVVAGWISLQYYASAVDNRTFGSGNKVIHNVVGALGVLEGTGGDLRVGLPWQSVHDGEAFVHEPLRLNVIIEAPTAAMSAVLVKNEAVAQLLDNGWIHLFRMDENGRVSHRYAGGLRWEPV